MERAEQLSKNLEKWQLKLKEATTEADKNVCNQRIGKIQAELSNFKIAENQSQKSTQDSDSNFRTPQHDNKGKSNNQVETSFFKNEVNTTFKSAVETTQDTKFKGDIQAEIARIYTEMLKLEPLVQQYPALELHILAYQEQISKLEAQKYASYAKRYFSDTFQEHFTWNPETKMIQFEKGAVYSEKEVLELEEINDRDIVSFTHTLKSTFKLIEHPDQAFQEPYKAKERC